MDALALFSGTPAGAAALGVLLVLLALGFTGAPLWLWAAAGLVALVGFGAPVGVVAAFVVLALVFNLPPLRRPLWVWPPVPPRSPRPRPV